MKRLLWAGLFLAMNTGCAPLLIGTGVASSAAANKKTPTQAVEANKKSLKNLSYGISRGFVEEVMGTKPLKAYRDSTEIVIANPYQSEKFSHGQKTYEVLYYATDVMTDDDKFDATELTPLVFQDGILIGWGWDAYNKLR